MLVFLFRSACFHASLPIPVLGFLLFLSPSAASPHSGYLSVSAFFLSASGLFPLAIALGSGYLASGFPLSVLSRSPRICYLPATFAIMSKSTTFANHHFPYFCCNIMNFTLIFCYFYEFAAFISLHTTKIKGSLRVHPIAMGHTSSFIGLQLKRGYPSDHTRPDHWLFP